MEPKPVRNERWRPVNKVEGLVLVFSFQWWTVKESELEKYVDIIDVTEFSLSVYFFTFDRICIRIPDSIFVAVEFMPIF